MESLARVPELSVPLRDGEGGGPRPHPLTGYAGLKDGDGGSKCHSASQASMSKLSRLSARSASIAKLGSGNAENGNAGRIIQASLAVNVILFFAKLWTFLTTGSLAVLASLVDSTIDLIAQTIILSANYMAERHQKSRKISTVYPVGMSRMEPLGVIICAVLMMLASAEVVKEAVTELVNYGGSASGPKMDFSYTAGAVLIVVILLKVGLWRWGTKVSESENNVSLEAISQDNYNDMLSNVAALFAAMMTKANAILWYSDPGGALVISAYIIWSWLKTAMEQIDMLVGKQASPDFLALIQEIAETHDPTAQLDVVRAYHFGPKFLVEVELVMDRRTPLQESHDVGMLLQDRIERLDDCERCFVHVDYEFRQDDDHDKSVPITKKITVTPCNNSHSKNQALLPGACN
jgi:cation diffusion facilitator family transporter